MQGSDEQQGANAQNVSEEKDYNAVLEYYVRDENEDLDLVGLLAYGLYKRHKRDWIIEHRAKHNKTKPVDIEVQAVVANFMTADMRNTLRERASDLLSSYAETYVEAVEPDIRAQAVNNETLRQAREIEQSIKENSSFWQQVGTGLIATAIWTLLVTVLVIAGLFFGSDLIDAWHSISQSIR